MNIRLFCGVLLGAASSMPVQASDSDTSKSPVVYVSRLPLTEAAPATKKQTDQLNFFCRARFDRLPPGASVEGLPGCEDERLESTRGTTVEVDYVYLAPKSQCDTHANADVALDVDEKSRKTVIAKEFSELVTAIASGAAKLDAQADLAVASPTVVCVMPLRHVLQLERADANLTVSLKSAPDAKASLPLVTGPKEHWFITGDAIVRGVKELKYDPDSKTIVEREKPQQLYLGINYMMGDVLRKYPWYSGERVVAKFMFLPNKHPFDSIGAGIGFRVVDGVFKDNDISGGLVIFAGSFWSKNDAVETSTGAVTQRGRSQSWRFGLSYDVSTLLGWLN